MDIRVVKTKAAIHRAFLELRSTSLSERVKVIDICDRAGINKSTFYKHYTDVYELNEELKTFYFDSFWNNFAEKDCMLSDPQKFIVNLPGAVDSIGNDVLNTLFRDREDDLFCMLESKLLAHYIMREDSLEMKVKKTFIICGIIHTLKEQKKYHQPDNSSIADTICSIIREQKL